MNLTKWRRERLFSSNKLKLNSSLKFTILPLWRAAQLPHKQCFGGHLFVPPMNQIHSYFQTGNVKKI